MSAKNLRCFSIASIHKLILKDKGTDDSVKAAAPLRPSSLKMMVIELSSMLLEAEFTYDEVDMLPLQQCCCIYIKPLSVSKALYKPRRSRNPGPHSNACNFCRFFNLFFLPVLSRPSFTSRTSDKDPKIEQPFYFRFVQVS